MKLKRIIAFFCILNLVFSNNLLAQQMDKRFDLIFISGLNIGATTPIPVPKELKITSYNPKLNPKLGAQLVYYFSNKWGLGTGFTIDWKGMNIHTKVSGVHLSIDVPNTGILTGYVTGKGTTKVNTLYLTQPVYGIYRFNSKWQIKAGTYLAKAISRKFTGDVKDIKIEVESPTRKEMEIPYATINYNKDVRNIDMGLLLGGEYRINDHIGLYTDFTWGFTPYFSKTVPIHFTMRNIYLSLGMTYRL